MRVRIKKATNPTPKIIWWYTAHIGKEFDVEPDLERSQYYYTSVEGSHRKHHIQKCDCEVIKEATA